MHGSQEHIAQNMLHDLHDGEFADAIEMGESFEQGARKKEQGKRMKFVYNPSGKEVKPPNYIFKNHSGDEIK